MESEKKSHLADLREAIANENLSEAHRIIDSLHPAESALLLESLPVPERGSSGASSTRRTGARFSSN